MAFDIKLSIEIQNCRTCEDAADELDLLIDYCEERMAVTTPSAVLQALAEAITGMNETQSLWIDKNKLH